MLASSLTHGCEGAAKADLTEIAGEPDWRPIGAHETAHEVSERDPQPNASLPSASVQGSQSPSLPIHGRGTDQRDSVVPFHGRDAGGSLISSFQPGHPTHNLMTAETAAQLAKRHLAPLDVGFERWVQFCEARYVPRRIRFTHPVSGRPLDKNDWGGGCFAPEQSHASGQGHEHAGPGEPRLIKFPGRSGVLSQGESGWVFDGRPVPPPGGIRSVQDVFRTSPAPQAWREEEM
jgi:hypothetical protein